MSKNKIAFLIGIAILVMPSLGFPIGFKNIFYVALGALLISLSVSSRIARGTVGAPNGRAETGIFDERSPQNGSRMS